jgi:hypothetical protein
LVVTLASLRVTVIKVSGSPSTTTALHVPHLGIVLVCIVLMRNLLASRRPRDPLLKGGRG